MMMVNHSNNNLVPWQSTIPDQMPWLNTSTSATCPTGEPMQFIGQPPYEQNSIPPTTGHSVQIDLTPISPTRTAVTATTSILNQQASPMTINPFNPQLSTNSTTSIPFYNNNTLQTATLDLTSSMGSPIEAASHLTNPNVHILGSLTHMPQQSTLIGQPPCASVNFSHQPIQQKRSSIEMEDDLTTKEAPPTKQQLSENILFDRFGSLQLDAEKGQVGIAEVDDSDEISVDSSDDSDQSFMVSASHDDRKEFNRYVYLLFKDKNSNAPYSAAASGAVERLLREEREKLSKAVIVWTPPQKPNTYNESDDDDDFRYKDHRDFLKRPADSSVIITEVEEDVPIQEIEPVEPDDMVVE